MVIEWNFLTSIIRYKTLAALLLSTELKQVKLDEHENKTEILVKGECSGFFLSGTQRNLYTKPLAIIC